VQQVEVPAPPIVRQKPVVRPRRSLNGRFLGRWFGPELAVTLLAGAIFMWRVGVPGPWRDEAATFVIADRSVPQILALARHIDLVHLAYYLGVHELMQLHPTALLSQGIPEVRMLSVLAAALAAGVLVRIGRQLDSLAVGLTAGLIFAVGPMSSRYAQEARPYALVILAATFATYALLRACRRPQVRRRWWVYGAAVAATGLLNVLGLFILAVHAVYLAGQAPRAVRRRWLTVAGTSLAAVAPFVLATFAQRGQIAWLTATDLSNLQDFFRTEYETLALPAIVIALGIIAYVAPSRVPALREAHGSALLLGLVWSVLPPVSMWLISREVPIFDWRYAVFTLPGTALLLASLARVARPLGALVPIIAVIVAGWPMQITYRDATVGHAEDIQGASAYVARHARAGDGVLFIPENMRLVEQLYPERFTGVQDLALEAGPISSATISGTEVPADDLPIRLSQYRRVWVVAGPFGMADTLTDTDRAKVEGLMRSYRIIQQRTVLKFTVFLYVVAGGDPDLPVRPATAQPAHPY
jgi:mannosyltransferase